MAQNPDASQGLMLVTTVNETLSTILTGQPRWLADHFPLTLVTSPSPQNTQLSEQEGVAVHEVAMSRGIHPLKDVISIVRMVRLLRRLRPYAIHSYTPKAGLVAMLAGWICQVPVRIHTFTGLIFPTSNGFRQRLLIWVDQLICACATVVVPEGLGVASDLQRFGVTDKPLQVIGAGNIAGVDCEAFDPENREVVRAAESLSGSLGLQSEMVFCFVGRLNRDKGLRELVAAFGLLENARLLVIGAVDETAPVDAATWQVLNSHPAIHLLGFMQDIRSVLKVADVLVLPSYREGFPNVLLQAGAMALPVIATDVNGCNEIVEQGVNGWLVPARDTQALHAAMRAAQQLPATQRKQMGEQAREKVKLNFERKAHWQRMRDFYQQVMKA